MWSLELGESCAQVAEAAAVEAAGEAVAALMHLLLSMELPRWTQEPTGLAAPAALAAQRLGSARLDSACSSSACSGLARLCLAPGSAP